MRTTLDLDVDVLDAARAVARASGRSLGKVVSDLARRGLAPRATIVDDDLFPAFSVPADAAPITDEAVSAALDER
jgi:hypothetical protein